LRRIRHEIDDHLMDLVRVADDARHVGQLLDDLDRRRERGSHHAERAARHARGINEMLSGILRAAEGEDLLDKVPRPLAR
jgi:hypothetical protein